MLTDLAVPVVVAPMAGGVSTPALVAAAVEAGATGFVPGGYLTAEALAAQIAAVRALTDGPFGVNLFVPGPDAPADLADRLAATRAEADRLGVSPGEPAWDDDHFAAKVDALVEARVAAVSFTFGLPPADVLDRLRAAGSLLVATVTTPAEAEQAAAAGVDALCVQGAAAGGHRATFADDPSHPGGAPLYDLVPLLRLARRTGLPVIAAGGLTHGADIAAVLTAGAVAAQLGTAFLLSAEAGTNAPYRAALEAGGRETALTRAFSGRPARGLVNRFLEEGAEAPAAYPHTNNLTKPVRAAAAKAGDVEVLSLWAGQAYPLAVAEPAATVITRLWGEARTALESASRWL